MKTNSAPVNKTLTESNDTGLKVVEYKYSETEEKAIMHFNNDNRFLITE